MVSVVEVRVITVATAHQESTGIWALSTSLAQLPHARDFRLDAGEALHQGDVAERVGRALGHVGVVALDLALQLLALDDDQRDQHGEYAHSTISSRP